MGRSFDNYLGIEPVREKKYFDFQLKGKDFGPITKKMEFAFIHQGLLLFFLSFLLGRAFILGTLTPFSLPMFAAVFYFQRKKSLQVFIGLIGGALTISFSHAMYSFFVISLFLAFNRTLKGVMENELRLYPLYVFLSVFVARTTWYLAEIQDLTVFHVLMSSVESGLALVLTLIFIQSVPVLSAANRSTPLKTEEIVCLIILLASVMTGMIDWTLLDISLANVFSRYLVLVFAFVAGSTVGSTVGVVTGLIFGLANIDSFPELSLLAFSGLLGGLLKEGKKIGVSFGLLVATLLIGMYGSNNGSLTISLYESLFATIFFFLTPKGLTERLAKNIPGTMEYSWEQQVYMRKIRDATAKRVRDFSSVFHALSNSFTKQEVQGQADEEKEIDYFLSNVTEKTCQTCFKKRNCWVLQFNKTYDSMYGIMKELSKNEKVSPKAKRDWQSHCVRSDKVIGAIREELHYYQANKKLEGQIKESRKIVAEQLMGVANVMDNFADEIQRELENHEKQEEQIRYALQSFGIEVDQIEIYSLDEGNVDIDIKLPFCEGMGQCEKLIAPLLTDILGETIVVHSEKCAESRQGYCHATFKSAKAFTVETGVVFAAKDGGFISGDSYTMVELGSGKFALAISDGMGNGERAHRESKEALSLLKRILQSGIGEEIAIKTINSILALRTTDEIYATLDLAIIDLQNAKSKFLKVGSMPSFIKRGSRVMKIQESNLPIGILQEFDVDVVSEQLNANDLLIMMSDGIYEGIRHVENTDVWMKRKISEIETSDPQDVADLIMEDCIRSMDGEIYDDMTVLVAKIKHNRPKWKTIPAISLRKMA